ncbi:tol-pal system protein YbgF [Marivibrio halodurans]|uniref:Cell division coordinator CpoB n=1 Tax=Marivibrio halodurans TaxID=2039722 RepID=A0A8J7S330_9PROT|nr:tol-pal system protein YbgF [Marivibrio halodurans]MBP5857683.1 tol-pal system protein YbgF [Marivibrio halodurans]
MTDSSLSARRTSATRRSARPSAYVRGAFAAAVLAMLMAPTLPAAAQSDLGREVEILKRDLKDLQRYIYRGEGTIPPASLGDGAAGQDTGQDTGTAPSGRSGEPMPSDVAGRLQIKIQRVEREMRELTGRVEEVEFRVRQAADRMEKLASDMDFRLQQLEQGGAQISGNGGSGNGNGARPAGAPQQLGRAANSSSGAGGSTGAATGTDEGTTVISSTGATREAGQGAGAAGAGQTLGSLRTNAAGEILGADMSQGTGDGQSGAVASGGGNAGANGGDAQPRVQASPGSGNVSGAQTTASAASGALPDGSVNEQYEYAFSLLRKRDFAAAEAAMRSFVDRHGESDLAGNAMYWLGETYYARGNYRDAAATFLDAYTGYPKNDKASHSLLKLAMSLGALGKTDAACQAFSTLRQEGDAGPRILDTAKSEAGKLGCGN